MQYSRKGLLFEGIVVIFYFYLHFFRYKLQIFTSITRVNDATVHFEYSIIYLKFLQLE